MKIKYFTEDGKSFDTKDEAIAYETKIAEEKKRQQELKSKQEERWKEVCNAYKKAEELQKKYFEDYKTKEYNLIDMLFGIGRM